MEGKNRKEGKEGRERERERERERDLGSFVGRRQPAQPILPAALSSRRTATAYPRGSPHLSASGPSSYFLLVALLAVFIFWASPCEAPISRPHGAAAHLGASSRVELDRIDNSTSVGSAHRTCEKGGTLPDDLTYPLRGLSEAEKISKRRSCTCAGSTTGRCSRSARTEGVDTTCGLAQKCSGSGCVLERRLWDGCWQKADGLPLCCGLCLVNRARKTSRGTVTCKQPSRIASERDLEGRSPR